MGRLSRTYSGTDNIAGLVVADGLTEGSCVVCDGTSEPIGIAVSALMCLWAAPLIDSVLRV